MTHSQFIVKKIRFSYKLKQLKSLSSEEKEYRIVDRIYNQKIFCNERILYKIFSFLEIKELGQIASVNLKLRMVVKYFFIEYQANTLYLNDILIRKNLIYSVFLTHIQKKLKIQKDLNKITVSQLQKLENEDQKQQLHILYCGLKANGYNLQSLNEVLPTLKQFGIKNCFSDIFNLSNQQLGSYLQDINIPDFKKSKQVSDVLNQLLEIIVETILYRKIYNAQVLYTRTQQQILKYLNWKQFDQIKKVVSSIIQPLNFRKNSSVNQYLNKNNLSIILSFLSLKDILQLKYTSKSINSLVSISLPQVVDFFQIKKELTLEKLQYNQYVFQQNFIYVNYFIIEYIVNKMIDKSKISINKVNQIINILSDLILEYENISSTKTQNDIELILNHLKCTHDDFNQIFQSESKSTDTEKFELLEQLLCQTNIILDNQQSSVKDQFIIDYIDHLHQQAKRILIYKKLMNQQQTIPLIYKVKKYNQLQFQKIQEDVV